MAYSLLNVTRAVVVCTATLGVASTVAIAHDHDDGGATSSTSQQPLSKDLEQFEKSRGDLQEAAGRGNSHGSSSSGSNGAAAASQPSERSKTLSRDIEEYEEQARSSMEGHRAEGKADSSSAPAHASDKSEAISRDLDEYYND